tara:strand:- start:606 stop:1328 length:723 start_codon:yes stop_codon:yes gene_type:complete
MSKFYRNYKTYIDEDHHQNIKYAFKFLHNKIKKNKLSKNNEINFLDVGCATGALNGFLSQMYINWNFYGLDYKKELIKVAKNKLPNQKWYIGNCLDLDKKFRQNYFDIVTSFGVLGVFDHQDAKKHIQKMLKITKKGGYIYIFSQFNNFPIDIEMNYRKNIKNKFGKWEKGWNNYSVKTIQSWINNYVKDYKFHNYKMPFNLPKKKDPIRSWTVDYNNNIQLTNGLNLLINLKLLEMRKK